MRYLFNYVLLTCVSFLILSGLQAAGKPYNVLFMIADDLNNDLGVYEHQQVRSPNLDRLADEGMRFDLAFCQYPLCGPSRTSMLTGLRPNRTQVMGNMVHFRHNKETAKRITLPQLFRNNGYYTARIGKLYHYNNPGEIGTSGFMDDPHSWDQTVNPRGRDKDEEHLIFSLKPGNYGGAVSWMAADGTDEEQTDGIGAAEAIELLEKFGDRQFFIAVGFYRPHTPYVAPKKYFGYYPTRGIQLPPGPDDAGIPPAALMSRKPEELNFTDPLRKEAIQAYWACNSFVDTQAGKLIDALDRLGLRDNTIIVWTSDHGYHLGEHGLWKKQSIFEESARVPLIVSVPGMKGAGKSTTRPVELIDLYPTLADLCGLQAPNDLDGISLRNVLNNPRAQTKPGAVTQIRRTINKKTVMGYAIRTEQYRYIEWGNGVHGVQLYDHEEDPKEYTNLAEDPDYARIAAELKSQLYKVIH
jgi:iduronate 2-sulfatase